MTKYNTPLHVVRAQLTKQGIDTTWNAKTGTLTAYEKGKTTQYAFQLMHGAYFFKMMLLSK